MTSTTRYFAELSYKGTLYHGWQIQPNALTVQELLNKALSTLFRQPIESIGCGRTDTGVHALQFFAHFDVAHTDDLTVISSLNSLNSLLPYDISVKRLFRVSPKAHARFDATLRSYEYHIHFFKDPFRHHLSWLLHDVPDIDKMNEAAAALLNYTDFSCFSKSNTQVATNNCTLSRAEWIEGHEGWVFHISANRFLRNMVRAIVGTLILVGRGAIPPNAIHDILRSKNRSNAGASVPACGLYLTHIRYPYIDPL